MWDSELSFDVNKLRKFYNIQVWDLPDLATTRHGICNFTRVGILSTLLYFYSICANDKISKALKG